MLYLAWDREINISLFSCNVFVWKWGPRPRTSSRCYHGNKSTATFEKGIFVHPPWAPNCMQNLKGVKNFHFPRCLILTDLFLTSWLVIFNLYPDFPFVQWILEKRDKFWQFITQLEYDLSCHVQSLPQFFFV